jgi:hypothetical protein
LSEGSVALIGSLDSVRTATAITSDGSSLPPLTLRELFEQFQIECGE